MQNLRKTNETGRSMVEMLGVLAIIGVLSVAGVAGYKAAVRKALANNLLNQASMRATDVATKIGSGNLDALDSDSFAGNLGGGVTMSSAVKGPDGYTDYDESDEQFTLTMEGVDEELCQQMQSMAGGSRSVVRAVLCDGDKAILTFNKDLSAKAVASDFEDNEEGCTGSGFNWCSGLTNPTCEKDCCSGITLNSCQESCDSSTGEITPKDDDTECTTADGNEGTCNAGVCEEATADYTGVECTDYQNNTECGGVGSDWYCQFSPSGCGDSDRGDGVCTAVGSGTSIKGGVYLKSPGFMDWWSAYSWCIGNNMNLVTGFIADHSLSSGYENYGGNGDLYTYFCQDMSFWTGHDYGSCYAWEVEAHSDGEGVFPNIDRNIAFAVSALCE